MGCPDAAMRWVRRQGDREALNPAGDGSGSARWPDATVRALSPPSFAPDLL